MPDIDAIQQEIHARLAQIHELLEPLRGEAEQLAKLLGALEGETSAGPAGSPARSPKRLAPKGPAPAGRRSSADGAQRGRTAASGGRTQQALVVIFEQPGITASELARAMDMSPNYLYRLLRRLEQEGKVSKRGKGYHPAQAMATAPTNGHLNGV